MVNLDSGMCLHCCRIYMFDFLTEDLADHRCLRRFDLNMSDSVRKTEHCTIVFGRRTFGAHARDDRLAANNQASS